MLYTPDTGRWMFYMLARFFWLGGNFIYIFSSSPTSKHFCYLSCCCFYNDFLSWVYFFNCIFSLSISFLNPPTSSLSFWSLYTTLVTTRSYFFNFSFSFFNKFMNLSSFYDFSIKICFFFSYSVFNSLISASRVIFLDANDFTLPCNNSFSLFNVSTCTLRLSNSLRLFYAIVDVRVVEKLLFVFVAVLICVNPLMWDTFTPLFASFYSSSLTLPLSLYIFCCLPFHALSSLRAWSILKSSPISLATSRCALFSSVLRFCAWSLNSMTFF